MIRLDRAGLTFGKRDASEDIRAYLDSAAESLRANQGRGIPDLVMPAAPPLDINSEGADGLAGILFGMGTRDGWGIAQLLGWECTHVRDSRGQDFEGMPDYLCTRERVVWVELKRQADRLNLRQVDRAAQLIAAGAEYYAVRPSDFTAICEALRRWR